MHRVIRELCTTPENSHVPVQDVLCRRIEDLEQALDVFVGDQARAYQVASKITVHVTLAEWRHACELRGMKP